jgi:signal transduction histidine kinase
MIFLAASTFTWTFGFLMETNSSSLEQQLFFDSIGYIGSMSVPVAWFVFALKYVSNSKAITKSQLILLCIFPLVTIGLVWSNNWHHLMWSNEHLVAVGSFLITAKTYGPFFWVALSYNYILIISGSVLLLRRLFVGGPLYRGQAIALLVAVAMPLIGNIIYVFRLLPSLNKDITPVMFAISGIAITLGLTRYNMLKLIPFAQKFIIDQLNIAVFVFNMRDRLLEANPAAMKLIRADRHIIGKKLDTIMSLSPLAKKLSLKGPATHIEVLSINDEFYYYEVETLVMRGKQNQQIGWLALIRDVSKRKKMDDQLLVTDRLASIGELVSGIAHEMNNPLTGIIGFSDLLLARKDLPKDVHEDLQIIKDESIRTASILKNLLTFARKHPQEKVSTDIEEVINKVLVLRAYEQKVNNIQVITNLLPRLPKVNANMFQLMQVFINIIINAEFFMIKAHGKGTLTITAEQAGAFIRIKLTDDGPGIASGDLIKIFNPFFTAKEVGKGTGLGLSICHGIVTEHGGRIWAESEQGKGACFIIELPIVTGEAIE